MMRRLARRMRYGRFFAMGIVGVLGSLLNAGPLVSAQSLSRTTIVGPGFSCEINAQTPHFSKWWWTRKNQYKVDTKGDGSCTDPADELQAQATLYYAAYIGLSGYWVAANPSPIATVYNKSSIQTGQSYTGCEYLSTNEYYGTAILWVNGGPPQDSPIAGPVSVECIPPQTA
ncbi:hypothetical protein Sulac_0574 [Sulfobacillus acidophilus DSM 10332]|uniref:Uncharacterized protein n=1 Tax=Sulfobacillus acidophilus (strain ATCC 700253 / DSM 10332 / NAL) TaxID=679936 RepID=G8TZD6_SULAD|nr:hypothetical protein Sulac_0574 [Sulfobacillus acidophilus DSM 10332]